MTTKFVPNPQAQAALQKADDHYAPILKRVYRLTCKQMTEVYKVISELFSGKFNKRGTLSAALAKRNDSLANRQKDCAFQLTKVYKKALKEAHATQ